MFRKLVSNLAFSPALVGQLGFYAKRLKKEEATRRVGLIFVALALVVQSFAVFSPPEAVNASSPADMVQGGLNGNINTFLHNYDNNVNNIKDLFNSLNIKRQDIVNTRYQTVQASSGAYNWALQQLVGPSQGGGSYTAPTSSGANRTYYYWPISHWGADYSTDAFVGSYKGHDGATHWFAIRNKCGNLMLKVRPTPPVCSAGTVGTWPNCTTPKKCPYPGKTGLDLTDPNCKPTPKCTVPGKTTLNANDPNCKLDPVAACQSLKITKLLNTYQYSATSSAANGATIKSYTYVTKKNGTVVDTKTISSSSPNSTYSYTTKAQGQYSVSVTVATSLGNKTSADCTKTFNVAPPEMCPQNPKITKDSPECQPCPDDPTLWIKDTHCSATVILSKTASNVTQGNVDAIKTTAKASDKIIYSLKLANVGKAPTDVTPVEELDDIAEYASIIDAGGGHYDTTTKKLSWPKVTLKAGETQTRMFTVQLLDTIPAMGTGTSNPESYDCKMNNVFGNDVTVAVDCPVQKQVVEQVVGELPHTGPRENMIFAGIVFAIVSYFYMRSRQVKKEIRLIRRDLNAGTI